MLSTCPSCLSQVNHPDHLFDVTCECGTHFSPFLNVDEKKDNSFSEYAESNAAFQDIVSFGEKVSADVDTPMEPIMQTIGTKETTAPPLSAPTADFPEGLTKGVVTGKEMLMTTGSELSGYAIQAHYTPLSVLTPLQAGQGSPLQVGFLNLWKMAEALGANGVIGLQAQVMPDGQNALLIAIPVRCSKVS